MRNNIDAADVKQSINPRQFYESRLEGLKPGNGWVDGGLCPFHADNHAGSFKVNLDTGAYKCFSCGAGGSDVIAFTMDQDGTDFPTTINALGAEYGVSGTQLSPEQMEVIRERDRLSLMAERMEMLSHELHVFLQVVGLRVADYKNMTDMKFREARPEWRPMSPEHWEREVEAAGNIVGMIRLCYPEVR